jgi:uncharacterized protein (TIGR00255 family)
MTKGDSAVYSMTGFATVERGEPFGRLQIDLRTVNHRYLDLTLRLPDELRPLESTLRERLSRSLQRGKVECRVAFTRAPGLETPMEADAAQLERLAALQQAILARFPLARPLSANEILRWPGVLGEPEIPASTLASELGALAEQALEDLAASRKREGEKIRTVLLERCTAIEAHAREVIPRIPELQAAFRERLAQRMAEAGQAPDPDRLMQEITLFATRIDVAEEVSRLLAHVEEVRRVLAAGGAVGKRLDFLMQELNREANTLGSKSMDTVLTRLALELKVAIEQMREQVQNLE